MLFRSAKINAHPCLFHDFQVFRLQDCASSAGHHAGWVVFDSTESRGFALAKSLFALRGKDLRDGAVGRLDDHLVGIQEIQVELLGQEGTQGAFARAG